MKRTRDACAALWERRAQSQSDLQKSKAHPLDPGWARKSSNCSPEVKHAYREYRAKATYHLWLLLHLRNLRGFRAHSILRLPPAHVGRRGAPGGRMVTLARDEGGGGGVGGLSGTKAQPASVVVNGHPSPGVGGGGRVRLTAFRSNVGLRL